MLNQGDVNSKPAWDTQQDPVLQNKFCGSVVCPRPLRPFTPHRAGGLSRSFTLESRWLWIQNPTPCEAFQLLPRAEIHTTLHGTYCSLQMTSRSRCGLFKQHPHRELKAPSSRRWWPHKTTAQPLTLRERGSEREGADIKTQDTTNGARTRNCCGEFHFFRPIHQVLFVQRARH